MWGNRFALCAFAAPFTVALAVPLFGPLAAAVAQGAAGNRAVARPGNRTTKTMRGPRD